MFREKVEKLLKTALLERGHLFLIDFKIGGDNMVKIVLDGDQGVSLNDCMDVSRAIEHQLDREEEDFSLEVTSSGATSPLVIPRQYKKHVGRKLSIKTDANEYEGILAYSNEDVIMLEWKAREPKPIGKGKHMVKKRQEIAFSDIKEAKVVLKF
ncbi:MAG: ribosome assembly cofactor RimP [Bacteroidota bacterium]